MHAESLFVQEGSYGGGEEGSRECVLGGGGSLINAQREPQASHRLLTTFSHMENDIGENLIKLWWPQGP